MKPSTFITSVLLALLTATALAAHDLFLRANAYFVPPDTSVRLLVLNGTFSKSENAVTKDRVRALSIAAAGRVTPLDTTIWADDGDTSVVTAHVGASGTYLFGASLLPREIRLAAQDFNTYLAADGIPDVLAARRKKGELARPARERYSKHVKALIQVGATRSDDFRAELGYPAEIIPLENPYSLKPGATLRIRALLEGKPAKNQLVIAGGRTASGTRMVEQSVRTNGDGVARIRLRSRGVWYVKFIHMEPAASKASIDYESKWATLTFGMR
jgi:uncharacterized GH25 family protein